MKRFLVCGAVLAANVLAVACGGDDDAGDCSDAPAYGEVTIFSKCVMCHDSKKTGNARIGAPPGVDFDDEAAALKSANEAAEEVEEGKMPPPGAGIAVTDAEKQALYEFAMCAD